MQDFEFQQIPLPQIVMISEKNKKSPDSTISTLQKTIIKQDQQMLQQQLTKLQKFQDSLATVVSRIDKSRNESSTIIDSLKKESRQLQDKISEYQKNLQKSNVKLIQKQIETIKKKYIAQWENRISIASELDVKPFKDIDLDDRKSLANELFKWIVVAIYGQPQSKFYWPNFKAQLFEKDDGKDFKQRLGKINASNAREEQILKVKDFLSKYSGILKSEQIADLKEVYFQAEKMRQVAQIYIECNQLAKKKVELSKSIQKDKQESLKKDEEAMKWKAKHEALEERLQVANQYMKTLGLIQKQLQQQTKSYSTKKTMAKEFLGKLKKGEEISQADMESYVRA